MTEPAVVHVLRHGQVDNPDHLLYGRLPGFPLSPLGVRMAERVAAHLADTPLTHLRCSPLLRARQTMSPSAALRPGLEVAIDDRLIEADNLFAGERFGLNRASLLNPRHLWWLHNPFRPSWGEPYTAIAERMLASIRDAALAAGPGGQALAVSHQLPIWTARRAAEGRGFVHDPRHRECTLASLTSFTVLDGRITRVDYADPVRDLLPEGSARPRRSSSPGA